jgi:hypothetical protein
MDSYTFSELITFTRSTNATLVDGTGLLTYAPNNLLLRSEEFDNALWVKAGVTVTANTATAPNGTTTADKVIPSAVTSSFKELQQNIVVTAGVNYTFSYYVKADGYSFVQFVGSSGQFGTFSVNYDLSTGTETAFVTGSSTITQRSITDAGSGWYRISVTATALATGSGRVAVDIIPASNSLRAVSWAGDGTSGVLMWGAQAEAVTYQTTAGTYNSTSPPNLLGFTQEFENAGWTKVGATISQNIIVSPDDTLNADKLVEDSSTGQHRVQQAATTVSGTSYTYSVYLKAGERTTVTMRAIGTATFAGCTINLTAGTISAITGAATITNAGNGWYRVSVTGAADSATSTCYVNLSDGGITYTGNGSSGAFVWGAQLSNSASVDPYVYNPAAAPTTTAYYGPRFDYNPTTLAPLGLLIEEQRVNLALYSEQFDNAAWTKTRSSITANATTSPDGTANADRFVIDTTAATNHAVGQSASVTSGTTYALTVFAKADQFSQINLRFSAQFPAGNAYYDLNSGTVSSSGTVVSASMTSFGNGWWRCVLVMTANATGAAAGQIFLAQSNSITILIGDGTSGLFLYGAQLEAGAFPSSYIPTVASTVTRASDNATMTGTNFSSWYNASEGTFVASAAVFSTASNRGVYAASDGSGANELFHYVSTTANNLVTTASISQANVIISGPVLVNTVFSDAFAYRANDISAAFNGILGTPDTSATIPTVNQLRLGARGDAALRLNGHLRTITYYASRLTNAQLQAVAS